MPKYSRWLSAAQKAVLFIGIAFSCLIVYNMLPAWDQLSSAQSYVAGGLARGEPISPKMQEALQRGQAQMYPFLWQLVGVAGMTISLYFIVRSRMKTSKTHPALKSDRQ